MPIDQKEYEEQRAHTLLQAVQTSSDMFGLTTVSGEITFVNEAVAHMTGRRPEEMVGQHFGTFFSPRNPVSVTEEIQTKGLAEGWSGDCFLLRHDGTDVPVFLTVGPIRNTVGTVVGMFGISRDISDRRAREADLKKVHQALNVALDNLQQQAKFTRELSEMVDVLQSCQDPEEAYAITTSTLGTLLNVAAGALYITSPSRDVVEAVGTWGTPACEPIFNPADCWALRRGKMHCVMDPKSPLRCTHISKHLEGAYVCLPLIAQGETLGVLHVEDASISTISTSAPRNGLVETEPDSGETQQRVAFVGERIALALANLRLREALHHQSIVDSLTGMYNRRFMEETLERELRRAERTEQPLALILMDIDRFKSFNDTFGHGAGDAMLRVLGGLIRETTRGQDIACRYGGEELAIVMTDTSGEAARSRAELLRDRVKHLHVQHGGQLLGTVTLSVGIAVSPDNGDSPDQLVEAADKALYRAKDEGRNTVCMASTPPGCE